MASDLAEVAEYVEVHRDEVDGSGRRLVVRNGYAQQRTLVTGVGTLQVRAPRVEDKRIDEQGRKFRFHSQILPPYLRRTRSVEELIPWLYLKGISSGDFSEALEALLGPDAPGLSATTVVRLKDVWRREYESWSKRSLEGQRFVYIWADGIYSCPGSAGTGEPTFRSSVEDRPAGGDFPRHGVFRSDEVGSRRESPSRARESSSR